MPVRPKRRRRNANFARLSDADEILLLTGHRFLAADASDAIHTEEQQRTAWAVHRDQFLRVVPGRTRCDADGCAPGMRPAAWWSYEAPEPLRIIGRVEERTYPYAMEYERETEDELLERHGLMGEDELALVQERRLQDAEHFGVAPGHCGCFACVRGKRLAVMESLGDAEQAYVDRHNVYVLYRDVHNALEAAGWPIERKPWEIE